MEEISPVGWLSSFSLSEVTILLPRKWICQLISWKLNKWTDSNGQPIDNKEEIELQFVLSGISRQAADKGSGDDSNTRRKKNKTSWVSRIPLQTISQTNVSGSLHHNEKLIKIQTEDFTAPLSVYPKVVSLFSISY